MNVGIIGHGSDKFDDMKKKVARDIIYSILKGDDVDVLVSGHSPVGGVDIWAEEIAGQLGIATSIFAPKQHVWDAEYGFKQRNLDIVNHSDVLYVILVRNYPQGYSGRTWFKDGLPFCYNCERHHVPSDHVKSGACWTAWEAKKIDKEVYWYILD